MKLVPLVNKITLKLENSLLHKIEYLCKEINTKEWSGVLFYKTKGILSNPDKYTLTAVDILPMDVGTTSTTNFEFGTDVVEYMMNNNFLDCKYGLIHSHHNMKSFFSETDISELKDNAPLHNNYLSLIVNNKMEFVAKLAVLGEEVITQSSIILKDSEGKAFSCPQEEMREQIVYTYDCIIKKNDLIRVDQKFKDRTAFIINEAKKQPIKKWNNNIPNQYKNWNKGFDQVEIEFNELDPADVEEYLITFFKGNLNNSLDFVIGNVTYNEIDHNIYSLQKFYKELNLTEPFKEFLILVDEILEPYEYLNIIKFKNNIKQWITTFDLKMQNGLVNNMI